MAKYRFLMDFELLGDQEEITRVMDEFHKEFQSSILSEIGKSNVEGDLVLTLLAAEVKEI